MHLALKQLVVNDDDAAVNQSNSDVICIGTSSSLWQDDNYDKCRGLIKGRSTLLIFLLRGVRAIETGCHLK